MACADTCPESCSQDPEISPGPVEDVERVARGAYTPMHGVPSNIRASFVRKKDLKAGTLSVWRISEKTDFDLPKLHARLMEVGPDNNNLAGFYSAHVEELRAVIEEISRIRAFCIKDECDIDDSGGKHPAHAHIAICKCLSGDGSFYDTPQFEKVADRLIAIFRKRRDWEPGIHPSALPAT